MARALLLEDSIRVVGLLPNPSAHIRATVRRPFNYPIFGADPPTRSKRRSTGIPTSVAVRQLQRYECF